MFVGDTFLTLFDRLLVKSTTTGKTGTFLGIVGLIAFIVISFLLFLGPVISYFKGDYIQGIFSILKSQSLSMYSGCQFKLAISFYSKLNGELVDHTQIKQFLETKVAYYSPNNDYFQLNPLPCSNDYFAEMSEKPHEFRPQDCFIVPNGIEYLTELQNGYISVFGFVFHPVCRDPFLCVYRGVNVTYSDKQIINFLSNHYYILRFTAQYLDENSNFKQKFYQIYSTQWQGGDTVTPVMFALLQTQKIFLDNSIMPWYNNITKIIPVWEGLTNGRPLDEYAAQISGTATFIATEVYQKVIFREYKKLDWLLGMLGGGIFLLFLIFWVPCNFISTTKQKVQNCYSTTLVRDDMENVASSHPPTFSVFWYISNILPFRLKCFARQDKIIEYSQKFLDIAEIIKKLKVAVKNLRAQKIPIKFEPRILQINEQEEEQNYNEEERKFETRREVLQNIRKTQQIPQIYQNNLPMLVLYDDGKNNENVKNKMNEIMQGQVYPRIEHPQFPKVEESKCLKRVNKCAPYFASFFKFFDAFGAKPNLTGNPENYTCLGWIISLMITCAAVLTFALTLANMGVTRTYWDRIYRTPQNYNISSTTGKQFRAAICLHPYAFLLNLVSGQNRVADFKFYQYKRQGKKQSQFYFDVDIGGDAGYFEINDEAYNSFDLKYCFIPKKGINITVYGDADSQKQAYIGFKAVPYCAETPASCLQKKDEINKKFYEIFSSYPMYIFLPKASYYPDVKKVVITPDFIFLTNHVNYQELNFTKPFEHQVYLNSLQTIDDYASWIMGDYPTPTKQILTKDLLTSRTHLKSIYTSSEPYYKLKISFSGNVERIIFSSYKIDFLFGTIGGCFMFFFFFFGCFGKAYNHYRTKVKLASILYSEEKEGISSIKYFLNWLRMSCCQDEVMRKIQFDINSVRIAKNVDAVYRLSAANYKNSLEYDLSLIYLKERIKADEQVLINNQQSSSQEEEDQFYFDWQTTKRNSQKRMLSKRGKNSIQNISNYDMQRNINMQKSQIQARQNLQPEPILQKIPTARQTQKCGTIVNSFDPFHNNPQYTLDGQRSIRSVFGGIFCICLFIFICVLTSHFLTIYFSQFHRVSQIRTVDQKSEVRKMRFEVGKNFKLAVSFYKLDEYKFFDVSNITKDVGISIIKYQQQKLQGSLIQIQKQKIPLTPCTRNEIQKFIDPHDDNSNYNDFDKVYCVPDGTILDLYGSADDPIRQYFSLKIFNKYGNSNPLGVAKVKQLLENYLPRYHISNPTLDYRVKGFIRYSLDQVLKSFFYQTLTSRNYNVTITKNIIKYDTAVNPSNQLSSLESYQIKSPQYLQFQNSFITDTDRYNELSFYPEQVYNTYTIKAIKINEVFGIVGGCIAFLFFGLGCIPRSYNEFKMRHMIGNKLYTILGRKKPLNRLVRSKKGEKSTFISKTTRRDDIQQLEQMSELRLMRAWILSLWGFIKRDYNTNDTMRVAALIESRVGKDINIFELMKTLNACENGIKKMNLISEQNQLNLCRIYPKQIVSIESTSEDKIEDLMNEVRSYPQLVEAARVNNFTYYQLRTAIQAKTAELTPELISLLFSQKWLDSFFGLSRTTVASQSMLSQSEYQSQSQSQSQKRSFREQKSSSRHDKKKPPTINKLSQLEQKSKKQYELKQIKKRKTDIPQFPSKTNLMQKQQKDDHVQEKVDDFDYIQDD